MREVQIVIRDDFDGSPDAQTIKFGWDGTEYEVDLSEVHRKEFAEFIEHYIEVARPVSGKKPKRDRSGTPSGDRKPGSVRAYESLSPEAIEERRDGIKRVREWARQHGYEVSNRSRVPNAIHDAYNAANPRDYVPNSTEFTEMNRGDS